jgi:hypothetical protein
MALQQPGLIFRTEAASSLVITPRMGESFRIRRIFVSAPSAPLQHLLVINDTARVGFFRTAGLGGSHLLSPRGYENGSVVRGGNTLDWMVGFANFTGYPVVQGEAMTLSLDTGTADIFALADSYDAGDVKSSEQCGSKSPDVISPNYGTIATALTATGYYKISQSRNPAEMVAFPFGIPGAGLVPAGKKAHVYVIGGQASGRYASAGNTASTQWIRPRLGNVPALTLFDRNDVGVPFLGNVPGSATVDYTGQRQAIPSILDPSDTTMRVLAELDFNGNDEFSLQMNVSVAGTGQLNANDLDVWVLMRVYPAS